jgi:hypothetical protein
MDKSVVAEAHLAGRLQATAVPSKVHIPLVLPPGIGSFLHHCATISRNPQPTLAEPQLGTAPGTYAGAYCKWLGSFPVMRATSL